MTSPLKTANWITLAIASGACAAFNGVFAKLSTTALTSTFASSLSQTLGLSKHNVIIEYGLRGISFGLNLIFNGVMWALFTSALARGTSSTSVSIINTSTNFMFTAVLGSLIFSELLPGLWWLGAGMLVAGSVIVGKNVDEGGKKKNAISLNDDNDGVRNVSRSGGENREQEGRDSDELMTLGESEREGLLSTEDGNGNEVEGVVEEGDRMGTAPNVDREL